MTVSTSISKSGPYAGAGTTGPFPVNFRFLDESHLLVVLTTSPGVEIDLALGGDYSVAGTGGESGSITLTSPLPAGQSLTILRNVPFIQEADYISNDAFPAESHERALDLLTMQTQQLMELISRAILNPLGWTGDTDTSAILAALAAAEAALAAALEALAAAQALLDQLSDGKKDRFLPGVDFDAGVDSTLTLTGSPPSANVCYVYFGGVYQNKVVFTLDDDVLTFAEALPDVEIEVVYFMPAPFGVPGPAGPAGPAGADGEDGAGGGAALQSGVYALMNSESYINTTAPSPIPLSDVRFDRLGEYAAGTFTPSEDGVYAVNLSVGFVPDGGAGCDVTLTLNDQVGQCERKRLILSAAEVGLSGEQITISRNVVIQTPGTPLFGAGWPGGDFGPNPNYGPRQISFAIESVGGITIVPAQSVTSLSIERIK